MISIIMFKMPIIGTLYYFFEKNIEFTVCQFFIMTHGKKIVWSPHICKLYRVPIEFIKSIR